MPAATPHPLRGGREHPIPVAARTPHPMIGREGATPSRNAPSRLARQHRPIPCQPLLVIHPIHDGNGRPHPHPIPVGANPIPSGQKPHPYPRIVSWRAPHPMPQWGVFKFTPSDAAGPTPSEMIEAHPIRVRKTSILVAPVPDAPSRTGSGKSPHPRMSVPTPGQRPIPISTGGQRPISHFWPPHP